MLGVLNWSHIKTITTCSSPKLCGNSKTFSSRWCGQCSPDLDQSHFITH